MEKFILLTTTHTEEAIAKKVAMLAPVYVDILKDIYNESRFVEFTQDNNQRAMYAILNEKTLEKLCQNYVRMGIDFKFKDLTSEVLYSRFVAMDELEMPEWKEVEKMAREFRQQNLTSDIVLDKISEYGSRSLTDEDKRILDAV